MAPGEWKNWGPFRYDEMGGMIWADGAPKGSTLIVSIRAHGFLTGHGHGAMGLPFAVARAVQDDLGRTITDFLNNGFVPTS